MATAHPFQPWRKTSALQATGSIPLTEDYQYRPLYPLGRSFTLGWTDMTIFATFGFFTHLISNALRKVPLHKGTIDYIKWTVGGAVVGQLWHHYYRGEEVRLLNHMMQLEISVEEMKKKQEPLLAAGKTLAQVYPLK